jgi:fengycin family lipopeptide synthetase B
MSSLSNILENKNCFITGATGGIGKEIAFNLASNKCNLFITSRDKIELKKLESDLKKKHEDLVIFSYAGDLNFVNDMNEIVESSRLNFNSFDILVNSAGVFEIKSLEESTIEDFEKIFNINVRAPFYFTKIFSSDMALNNWGRIVNIGSSSSYNGFENTSLYCASKHSILGFSRSIHSELKTKNIRTYCISPASTKSKMGKLSKNQDFNTFINPAEIAEVVTFLISLDSEMVIDEIRLNRMIIQ